MTDIRLVPFYYPWPNLGVKLSRQWENLRDNTEKEAPLIRAAYVDPQPVSANEPGEHDLSGWAIGERDFRNKFRIYYDKTYDRFSIQYNSGTEPVEIWNDYLSVRDVDGRVTVHGYGGLDATAGGFYTPLSRNLAVSATFSTPSLEWQWTHNLNAKPILWNTFNMEDKSITPISVDVSNPNIAYFYFTKPYAGRAIAGAEHLRGAGIRITDGSNNFTNATILQFNSNHFYITHGLEGYPAINLQPSAAAGLSHSALADLTADDHSQYLLTAAATSRALFATNWTDLTDTGASTLHKHDHGGQDGLSDDDHTQYSLADGTRAFTGTVSGVTPTAAAHLTTKSYVDGVASLSPGFYGIIVRESDGNPPAFRNDTLIFDSEFFYLHGTSVGKPTVSIRSSGGASAHSALTGLSADDHAQYLLASDATSRALFATNWTDLTDGGATTLHSHEGGGGGGFYGIYVRESDGNPPTFVNDTITFDSQYFYIVGAGTGNKPLVSLRPPTSTAVAHSDLTGLSADDHTQYILADGTRKFTGVQQGHVDVNGAVSSTIGFYSGFADIARTIYIGNDARRVGPSDQSWGIHLGASYFDAQRHLIVASAEELISAAKGTANAVLNLSSDNISAGALLIGLKSASGNVAAPTPVVADEMIMEVAALGYTPAQYHPAGRLSFLVDVEPDGIGAHIPGRIVLSTNEGVGDECIEALRIDSAQIVTFSKVAVGVTPTAATHLATKGYVDTTVGPGFYGIFIRESDGNPPTFVNDTITFDSQYFYIVGAGTGNKPLVSLRPPTSSAVAHSDLTGLSADDHTQYILADGTRQFTGELQGRLKVAASITTAHSFYGDYGELAKHIYVGDHEVDAPVVGLGTGFGQPSHRTLITASAIGGISDETLHLRLHSNSSASDHAAMIVGTKNASGDRTFATSPVEDDSVLIIQAGGYAGGSYEPSSKITFQIDTPITNVNYLPGRIVFSTQDGTGAAFAEAFRIDKSQIATFTKVAVGVTPTSSTHLATKGYVDTTVGPAFYGIYVRESDGNPPTYRNDTITFDSQYFYLHSNSVSKPTVSMRDNFPKRFVQSFPIGAQEWQVNHNLGTNDIIFNVWDNRQISIIPDKADASNPNTAFFYFTTFRTGKACILGI